MVLNRGGLERSTCECYSMIRTEYERLLPRRLASTSRSLSRQIGLEAARELSLRRSIVSLQAERWLAIER